MRVLLIVLMVGVMGCKGETKEAKRDTQHAVCGQCGFTEHKANMTSMPYRVWHKVFIQQIAKSDYNLFPIIECDEEGIIWWCKPCFPVKACPCRTCDKCTVGWREKDAVDKMLEVEEAKLGR